MKVLINYSTWSIFEQMTREYVMHWATHFNTC